jgi:hypothetical protein
MITRRWLGVSAVTATCAAFALLGIGGDALAGSTATPGQIKACYKTGVTLPPLTHIGTSAACPTGDNSLVWNKVGPQGPPGPAGVSVGSSGVSGTSIVLDQAQTLTPVLSSAAVPTGGTYYVNASVMLVVAQGDTVACILDNGGSYTGAFATVGPVANQTYETLPLTGMMNLSAGAAPAVACADYTANANTSFYDGGITATLINSATGNLAPATRVRPSLPPRR